MAFALDLSKFIEKAQGNAETVVRKVGIDMLAKVVDRSPVGNPDLWKGGGPEGYVGGRFRRNWQVTFGRPAQGEVDGVDPSGSATNSAGAAVLASYRSGINSIWLANNVPYSYRLEMGHSSQAPLGVAGVTATEFQSFVDQAVRELDT